MASVLTGIRRWSRCRSRSSGSRGAQAPPTCRGTAADRSRGSRHGGRRWRLRRFRSQDDEHAPAALTAMAWTVPDAFAQRRAAPRAGHRRGPDPRRARYLLHHSVAASNRGTTHMAARSRTDAVPAGLFDAVRAAFPAERRQRGCRHGLGGGGWDIEDRAFAQALEARACSSVHCPVAGCILRRPFRWGRVPLPLPAREAAGAMRLLAVGLITDFDHAESIIANGIPTWPRLRAAS